MSDRAKRQRLPVAIIFVAAMLGMVAMSFGEVRARTDGDIPCPISNAAQHSVQPTWGTRRVFKRFLWLKPV